MSERSLYINLIVWDENELEHVDEWWCHILMRKHWRHSMSFSAVIRWRIYTKDCEMEIRTYLLDSDAPLIQSFYWRFVHSCMHDAGGEDLHGYLEPYLWVQVWFTVKLKTFNICFYYNISPGPPACIGEPSEIWHHACIRSLRYVCITHQ